MRRGEVRWAEHESGKRRPVLILTRDQAIPVLHSVVVAPATRTVRGIPSEIVVGPDDGMPADSAFAFDNVTLIPKEMIGDQVCDLGPERMWQACEAMKAAFDC